jgi:hypothetical protein
MAEKNYTGPLYEAGGRYQEDIARSFGRALALDDASTHHRIWDNDFEAEVRHRFQEQHPTIQWEGVRDLVYDAWVQHTESRFMPGPRPYYNPEQLNDGRSGEQNRRATRGGDSSPPRRK